MDKKIIDANFEFECCFCGNGIELSKANPADIIITINFDKPAELQYSQTFFCHIECFYNKLHQTAKNNFYFKKYL